MRGILILSGLAVLLLLGCNHSGWQQLTPDRRAAVTNAFALAEDSLAILADSLRNAPTAEDRRAAARDFQKLFVEVLHRPFAIHYPFERLGPIARQVDPSRKFRIFSWQLFLDPDHYQYGGVLQILEEGGATYPLQDRSESMIRPEQAEVGPEEWYGMVYYHLEPFGKGKNTRYLLFGFDGFRAAEHRKLVDVLTLTEAGPLFGAPVFVYRDTLGVEFDRKSRLVIPYAVGSRVRCNMDPELNKLVFDHTIPYASERDDRGLIHIPDGTYEAFSWTEGEWRHEEKVFHEVLEEAPVERPVLDKRRGRDIFGRQ